MLGTRNCKPNVAYGTEYRQAARWFHVSTGSSAGGTLPRAGAKGWTTAGTGAGGDPKLAGCFSLDRNFTRDSGRGDRFGRAPRLQHLGRRHLRRCGRHGLSSASLRRPSAGLHVEWSDGYQSVFRDQTSAARCFAGVLTIPPSSAPSTRARAGTLSRPSSHLYFTATPEG
jgi:hypothetical protein